MAVTPVSERCAAAGRGLLFIAIASLAIMRPQLRVGGLAVVPTDVIMMLAGGCWLAALVLARRLPRYRWFHVLLLAYLAAMTASAVFADPPFARFALRLVSQAYLLGLAVMVADLLVIERQLRAAVRAWLAGTALVVALAAGALGLAVIDPAAPLLAPLQHHLGSLPLGPFVRYKLAYENPNMLGAYLAASLTMALLAAKRGWVAGGRSIWLIAGTAMATVATFSAGIGAAVLAITVWFRRLNRVTRPHMSAAILLAGSAVAAAFVLAQALTPVGYADPLFRLAVPGTNLGLFPASRMQTWVDAARTFARHPLTGAGVGSDAAHVRFVEPGGAHVLLRDAHNAFLSVAAGCGAVGVVALALIVAAVWRRTRAAWRGGEGALATLATGWAILDLLVYQGIGGSFEDARFLWVLVGLWLAATRLDQSDAPFVEPAR